MAKAAAGDCQRIADPARHPGDVTSASVSGWWDSEISRVPASNVATADGLDCTRRHGEDERHPAERHRDIHSRTIDPDRATRHRRDVTAERTSVVLA